MKYSIFIIGVIITAVLAYFLIDLWIVKYYEGPAQAGAGIIIGLIMLSSIIVTIDSSQKEMPEPKPQPKCDHEWHQSTASSEMFPSESCILCNAQRGSRK